MRKINMLRKAILLAASLSLAPYANAQTGPEIKLEAVYIADIYQNNGGIEDGSVYLDNLGLAATTEFSNGTVGHVSLLYNNGNSLTELTGDSFAVSNIETGVQTIRLYEAWLSRNFGEQTNLKLGFFDVNSEFDVLDSSGLFIGSAHGIGMDIGQTGENGPSIFPVPGLAIRLEHNLSDKTLFRAAIIEGIPGDPDKPKRTTLELDSNEGAFLIGEIERRSETGKALLGGWAYTAEQASWDSTSDETNFGLYLRGETLLTETSDGRLTGFGRIGWANASVNNFSGFSALGLHYARNNGHEAGLGIAHATASDERKPYESLEGGETAIELTYAIPLNDNFTVQPNFQYIISPSADPMIDDAHVFGLRFIGSLSN